MAPKLKICAIVPAAGSGTRLGIDRPKIFAPITRELSIWDILLERISPFVDHLQIVLSPSGFRYWEENRLADVYGDKVSVATQTRPIGTGDAVFSGSDGWETFDHILVIWGDQIHLSAKTLAQTIKLHKSESGPHFTIPLTWVKTPYVEYTFSEDKRGLQNVLMSREGDACRPEGWSDVGIFCLSVAGLIQAWQHFCHLPVLGKATGELNFLPFLSYLSTSMAWPALNFSVEDSLECRGVNTAEDLRFFQELHTGTKKDFS